jgi:uncharacterized protein YjbJ (UPF0337 family)
MITQLLKGNWNTLKGSLKQKYAQLTDDDLKYVEGKEDELLGKIQKKLGITQAVLEKIISEHAAKAKTKATETTKK